MKRDELIDLLSDIEDVIDDPDLTPSEKVSEIDDILGPEDAE